MIRSAPIALLAAVAAPMPAGAQQADLASVQRFLQSVTTMTADFSQADRNGRVLTGTLSWKQPGKIRFQYQKDVPLLIVAEGGALTFVDYSVRQVQRWPIRNSPLGVLLDPRRDLAQFARVVPGGDPRLVSVEARDPKHPEYGRITLVFARDAGGPAGLTLQGWVALDSQNNRTTVKLSNQRYGGTIADNAFKWVDPRRTVGRR
ncbi:outer-membrane lipoprotein carrier protein [Sphingomonas metalli]|uniref:Outer-membrane lipoprotein carrier protein n=1 Tax=Sphingomonas metalli TaxID=1779358 RepID=A0A916SYF1_9SPHN|nr:outer membrane lipoprotein carrier protein LolA [Sphingomonas metalli]GGB23383.1 outer-membrane lipoprotein carrier protein [Sphingomonas metalli]